MLKKYDFVVLLQDISREYEPIFCMIDSVKEHNIKDAMNKIIKSNEECHYKTYKIKHLLNSQKDMSLQEISMQNWGIQLNDENVAQNLIMKIFAFGINYDFSENKNEESLTEIKVQAYTEDEAFKKVKALLGSKYKKCFFNGEC